MRDLAILGVGNILQKDDGIAIYATQYLEQNYTFEPELDIINGGVDGLNLLNIFMEYRHIIILDAIDIDDEVGSIYFIPSHELSGFAINSSSAHELGILECFSILELLGEELPKASVLGITVQSIDVEIALSDKLHKKFDSYIDFLIDVLQKEGYKVTPNSLCISLSNIIEKFKNPRCFEEL